MRNWRDYIGVGITGFVLGVVLFIAVILVVSNIREGEHGSKVPKVSTVVTGVYYVRYSGLVKSFKDVLNHINLNSKQKTKLLVRYKLDLLKFAHSFAVKHQAVVIFSPSFAAPHSLILQMKDITPIFMRQEKAKKYYKTIIAKLKKENKT